MPDKVKKIVMKTPVKKESGIAQNNTINDSDTVDPPSNSSVNSSKPKIFKQRLVSKGGPINPNVVRDDIQGINIDKTTAHATPEKFERKVIKYGSGASAKTKIIGSDGKVIHDGRDSDKATQDALRENASKSKDTNKRREKNAESYHWNQTAKQELSEAEKKKMSKK